VSLGRNLGSRLAVLICGAAAQGELLVTLSLEKRQVSECGDGKPQAVSDQLSGPARDGWRNRRSEGSGNHTSGRLVVVSHSWHATCH
jgi:hypothetical protein